MISTHWSSPHEPSARDLRLLDIVVRQAADLIERKSAEEKLEQTVEERTALLRETVEELEAFSVRIISRAAAPPPQRPRQARAFLPVLILTSSTHTSDLSEAYQKGANGFLVKPSTLDELVSMVQANRTSGSPITGDWKSSRNERPGP